MGGIVVFLPEMDEEGGPTTFSESGPGGFTNCEVRSGTFVKVP